MIERVGKAAPASKCVGMLGAQDLVLKIDDLLIFAGGFRVFPLPVESKRDVVTGPKSIGVLGPQHFLPDGKNPAMFCFSFSGLAGVIEGNSEAIPSKQGIGMHRAEDSFFESYDAAETFDGLAVLALAILRVSDPGAAPPG